MVMLSLFGVPPEIRDVFAFYILIGVMVLLLQYVVKYTWNCIARLIARAKGEQYRPPPF